LIGNSDPVVISLQDENENERPDNKKRKTISNGKEKSNVERGGGKKTKSTGKAIEDGLAAVSKGLISLGESLAPGLLFRTRRKAKPRSTTFSMPSRRNQGYLWQSKLALWLRPSTVSPT